MREAFLILLTAVPLAVAAIDRPVRVDGGLISGVAGSAPGVRAFKGIPFAAPPIYNLRWKSPQAVPAWQGAREAGRFGPACIQEQRLHDALYWKADDPISEDCLYLNVWTPAASPGDKLPVLVWIHGGAFTQGSGSGAWWLGDNLAAKGAVVVTFNYRLGVFGFFAHADLTRESGRNASGNYGLLDQVYALEWVHRNIAAFGGDPGNVAICGESSGSASVNYLMASPLAKGLFRRAIGQSGATMTDAGAKLAGAEQAGARYAESAHARNVAELRAMSADDIRHTETGFRPRFRPIIDGYFLPADTSAIFAQGRQNDVPLITGSNENEQGAITPHPPTAKVFIENARRTYGDRAGEFLKLYPAADDEQAARSFYAAARDRFAVQSRAWARAQIRTGKSKVYMYRFAHPSPIPVGARFAEGGDPSRYGAYHGAEIIYAFRNLQVRTWPWRADDRNLAEVISSYWLNLARTGDPNGKRLPLWPPYDAAEKIMIFGAGPEIRVAPLPDLPRLSFLESSLGRRLNP